MQMMVVTLIYETCFDNCNGWDIRLPPNAESKAHWMCKSLRNLLCLVCVHVQQQRKAAVGKEPKFWVLPVGPAGRHYFSPNVLSRALHISGPQNWYFNSTERNLTWRDGERRQIWYCT